MKFFKMITLFTILVWFTSCDESGENLFVFPSTPYLGITSTLESGDPAPWISIDYSDWGDIPEAGIFISAAYPNPTDSVVTLRLINPNDEKRGLIYLHHPFTNQIEIVVDEEHVFYAGAYSIKVNLKEMKFQKGIIRAYFKFGGGISWGDIFYK